MVEQYVQVGTTIDSREGATTLARAMVQARVAACAQVLGPITSAYWWDGQVETDDEWMVLAKTTVERYGELERHLTEQHPYDVPEIIATPITHGIREYLDWISVETQSG